MLSSLVLKIFKLELFFEKINSAIANDFGHIRFWYGLSFLYTSLIFHQFFYYYKCFSDVNEHVMKVKACLNH